MPGADGIDVLSELKKFNATIPVIILSGVDSVKTVVEAIKLGADPYAVIRPEGRWHKPGILERSCARPATNPSVVKKRDNP